MDCATRLIRKSTVNKGVTMSSDQPNVPRVGTLLSGRSRLVAIASGAALAAASALTRMGIVEAGMESASDPKYTVRVQRDRLAERRRQGVVHDSAVTVR